MSEAEQEAVLFFKLYLLARKANYINYMANTKILLRWFDFTYISYIKIDNSTIYCGSCFEEKGHCFGGSFTISCTSCNDPSNMAYEIQQLCRMLNITWNLCIYLMCRAIEDIYKSNNVICFRGPLF